MKKFIKIGIPEENRLCPIFQIQWSTETPVSFINEYEYTIIKETKKKLDIKEYHDKWDEIKKYSNPFELIHVSTNKKKLNENISSYVPLSRSYFKMIEILQDFLLLEDFHPELPFISGHLAEGPGGFIEAILNKRRRLKQQNFMRIRDQHVGITLRSTCKEIPGWDKSQYFLQHHPEVNVYYGKDNTGNIYNVQNLLGFQQRIGVKCDMVTGDGGIDFSIDFNLQEVLSYRLILCQMAGALLILKEGGHFICKIFDTYTRVTIEILWLLSLCFREINIVKPLTSRPANGERYVVCKYFCSNSDANARPELISTILTNLLHILSNWNTDQHLIALLADDTLPMEFMECIQSYNSYYCNNQLQNINDTLALIQSGTAINYQSLLQRQIEVSTRWCKKYNVGLNQHCIYLRSSSRF